MVRQVENSPLGKSSSYSDQYDPELLFAIPRKENRTKLLHQDFEGFDWWNAYELSWLDANGKPQVRQARFEIQADSKNLIESKSLKLYLNSLNQTSFSSESDVVMLLLKDIGKAVQGVVKIDCFPVEVYQESSQNVLKNFTLLDDLNVSISHYQVNPDLLTLISKEISTQNYYSHLLKSNCPVTSQPDWGSIFIQFEGPQIDPKGLLAYLISFRNHNEFHEHCVEEIFSQLMEFEPRSLMVAAKYVRRGGLDINPIRIYKASPVLVEEMKWVRLSRQ